MANCDAEAQDVKTLEELLAELQPDVGATPSERAMAQRQMAVVRRQLIVARAALGTCRARHTRYEVRLRVIRMANDDGSNPTAVTPANVTEWVRITNLVFAPARIRILFEASSDFETKRNTRLNQLVEGTGLLEDEDAVRDADAIADQFPTQIVMFCRVGRPLTMPPFGNCGPGCGYSGFPGKYVMMPSFDGNLSTLLAHELGHFLGLPHTFRFGLDTTFDAQVVFDILDRRLDALEGDSGFVFDTPPEMFIRDQDAGVSTRVVFYGKTVSFLRDNVMSYYRPLRPGEKTVTPSQSERMRSVLQLRRLAGLGVVERLQ